jgi:predicted methyltransferase
MTVLSRYQAAPLIHARLAGQKQLTVSLDLNRTTTDVILEDEGVRLPEGILIAWPVLAEIADHDNGCFAIDGLGFSARLHAFSPTTRRAVMLCAHPTGAPTMILAGFPMHRTKEVDPMEDTRRKLAVLAPVAGRALDTATGLGYTAIGLAAGAASVTTIELDPTVLQLASKNPWSQALFEHPRITQKVGSAYEVVPTFADGTFDLVLHDPPTLQLAGELYSGDFYRQLWRVLSRRGRLFHYIGSPDSRHGATVTRGVVRRLHEAGFEKVAPAPDAYGVMAWKEKPRR